jgi:hypothetical protein
MITDLVEMRKSWWLAASKRSYPLVSCILITLLAVAPRAASQDTQPLRVTVIAVTEFDHAELRNKELLDGINLAKRSIELFSQTQGATLREFQTRDDTTAEAIRKWLFYDLSRDTEKSIHLVFILTHGVGYQYSGSTIFKNELFLASSDTKPEDYFGVAIRGSELIDAFQRLPQGSSVFLFLDTCGSGSIDNSGISQLLQIDSVSATRMMILAASMAEESAFTARFTRALVDIWQSPEPPPNDCHSGETSTEEYLNGRMNAIEPLDPKFSQNVNLIFPYTNDFCLESFGTHSALALLANPTTEELKGTVRLSNDPRDTHPFRVKARSVRPMILRRQDYAVDVQPAFDSSSLTPSKIDLDLSTDHFKYQQLYLGDPLNNALVKREAARYATGWGVPSSNVDQLLSSATQDLTGALNSTRQKDFELEQTITNQQRNIQSTEETKTALDTQLATSEKQLAAEKAAIGKRATSATNLAEGTGTISLSDEDRTELKRSEDTVSQRKASVNDATSRLDQFRQVLSNTTREKEDIEARLASISDATQEFVVSDRRANLQRKTRAELIAALNGLFPTQDTSRGLILEVPPETTPQQIADLGKLLASKGSPMLIEVETYVVPGPDIATNQKEAIRAAKALQEVLVRGTGIDADWTVVRGFTGLPNRVGSGKQRVQQIVISGDLIGETPSKAN